MPTLKDLIAGDDLVVAPVALNPIMARLAEAAGFKAVYLSGEMKEAHKTCGLDRYLAIEQRTKQEKQPSQVRKVDQILGKAHLEAWWKPILKTTFDKYDARKALLDRHEQSWSDHSISRNPDQGFRGC